MSKPIRSGRTIRLTERRIVDLPQQQVFDYTADFSNIVEWDPGVAASTRLDTGEIGSGARFELEVVFGSSSIPMTYEITVFEPSERVVLEGRGKKIHAVDDIRFRAADDSTIIEYTADLTFNNFVRFLLPFLGRQMEAVGTKALDGLAGVLNR